MNSAQRANLERLLNPRHIAFIGGSEAAAAIGEAQRVGFAGRIWPVNPKLETLAELPCFRSVRELPEPPDAVFLAIPAASVVEITRLLSEMGAGGMVCYTAGFGETGTEGREREQALRNALGDMALVGPNCYGIINYLDRAALWPFPHGGACPGYGAAIITQSGMLSSDITMSQRSLPLAYMVSTGNQAGLEMADFIDCFCDKPQVRTIGLHIEGLSDIAAFERAALKALRQNIPIVALKTGNSSLGSTLAMSHTASLAGTNELYQALFERIGVISVSNPSQLLETLKFLSVAGAPAGTRMVAFTCSGGGAAMLADHAEEIGLSFPEPSSATCETLAALLPPIATVSNPLDYTTPIWGQPESTGPVFARTIQEIPADTAILVQDYPPPELNQTRHFYLKDGLAFAEAVEAAKLPAAICSTLPENMDLETREILIARNLAPMQGIHETLNAIRDAARWRKNRDRILATPPPPLARSRPPENPRLLDEALAKERLAEAGLSVPQGRVATGELLEQASREIRFPVALKMMGPALAHKTEAGAVMLGLGSPEEVAAAAVRMREAVRRHDAAAVTDRFLVESMAPEPLAELIVGIRRDPQFGFVMTLGSGGILVELVGDVMTLLLPSSMSEISAALKHLKGAALLNGFRGRPRADFDILAGSLLQLSEYALAHPDDIAEIEINPLFVYEDRVMAVDALVRSETAG